MSDDQKTKTIYEVWLDGKKKGIYVSRDKADARMDELSGGEVQPELRTIEKKIR